MHKSKVRGFSLIELMIVVGIVGILAAIAYPSYNESVLKGRRAEGRTALTDLMIQQERYMTQNGTYFAFTNALGVTVPAVVPLKTYSGESSANPLYDLSAAACGAQPVNVCIQLSATPRHVDAKPGNLTFDSTGTKSCNGGSDVSVCWK